MFYNCGRAKHLIRNTQTIGCSTKAAQIRAKRRGVRYCRRRIRSDRLQDDAAEQTHDGGAAPPRPLAVSVERARKNRTSDVALQS
jgi:hypothetical protein